MLITKTDYATAVQCLRKAYCDKVGKKNLLTVYSRSNLSDMPNATEAMVRTLYPKGFKILNPNSSFIELFQKTVAAMKRGAAVIYNPVFICPNHEFIFIGDLLVKEPKRYRLIEVKSGLRCRNGDVHDVGFYRMVLSKLARNIIHDQQESLKNILKPMSASYLCRKRSKTPNLFDIDLSLAFINKEYRFSGKLDHRSMIKF